MAVNIFTVRHGEGIHQIDANIWNSLGNADIPLTKLGIKQARECGMFLKKQEGLTADNTVIISSPFARAYQTAEQIAKLLPGVDLFKETLLMEQNFGLFTGLSTPQCYEIYPAQAKLYDLQEQKMGAYYVKAPQGESRADVVARIEKFTDKISDIMQDSRINNIIIVSHCTVGIALGKVLNKQTPEWMIAQEQIPNCSINHYSYNRGKWQDHGLIFVPSKASANISLAVPDKLKGKEL